MDWIVLTAGLTRTLIWFVGLVFAIRTRRYNASARSRRVHLRLIVVSAFGAAVASSA